MQKKEETPQRRAQRNYERRHKEERERATKQFNTRIPRETCEQIEAFLKETGTSKVELILLGYETLKSRKEPS